jgi:hypothetical protein
LKVNNTKEKSMLNALFEKRPGPHFRAAVPAEDFSDAFNGMTRVGPVQGPAITGPALNNG